MQYTLLTMTSRGTFCVIRLLAATFYFSSIFAFKQFQEQVPNGGMVPNPCKMDESSAAIYWAGLGHQTDVGGSVLNPFGKDFQMLGKRWSEELCLLDSDGDGEHNGAELGDPDCRWTQRNTPDSPAKSHPGICEPLDTPDCKELNNWLRCDRDIFPGDVKTMCEHVDEESTFHMDVRLSNITVPPSPTVYACQVLNLNISEEDLHMIAVQPIVDTVQVVHHILLFECDFSGDNLRYFDDGGPYYCDMVPNEHCKSIIAAWTRGSDGQCAHPDMGFRMGLYGTKSVAIQVHMNNPSLMTGITDSSGLRIHLTRKLRQHDAGILAIGQRYLNIEPLGYSNDQSDEDLTFTASCPGKCTQHMLDSPIYITSAINHMHYLGRRQSIKLYRNNSEIQIITDQNDYSYDDPIFYTFKDPIKVEPGDELRTSCTFARPDGDQPVCWGEATVDEMCFGFLIYYPVPRTRLPWCTSMNSFPSCERHIPNYNTDFVRQPFDGCDWWDFRNISNPTINKLIRDIQQHCYSNTSDMEFELDMLMSESVECTEKCRETSRKIMQNPCLKGEARTYMIEKFRLSALTWYIQAILKCSCTSLDYCTEKIITTGSSGYPFLPNEVPKRNTNPCFTSFNYANNLRSVSGCLAYFLCFNTVIPFVFVFLYT